MVDNLVLVPSSRFVDKEMQLEVGKIPPVLIPINGKPLFEVIIEKYSQLPGESRYVLILSEGKELVQDYLCKRGNHKNVQLVEIPLVEDLGSAIRAALEQVDISQYKNLFLNFGDTLVDADLAVEHDAIFYDDLHESFRWTTFEEAAGTIRKITDKFMCESLEPSHVFTGLFLIKNPQRFLETLRHSKPVQDIGSFYSSLQQYLGQGTYELVKVKEWLDFGHVDNYYRAKKRFVNTRFFNQIEIDEHRATITKKSVNVEKFTGEIRWYLEMPSDLKCYLPQVYDYSISGKNTFIKMEYYGYPTVGELYMFGGHSLGIWNHVFDSIFRVLGEMRSHQLVRDKKEIDAVLEEMYITKTLERLQSVESHPILGKFLREPLVINKREYRPVKHYLSSLPAACEKLVFGKQPFLSVIHGDFCLSNILFDPRSRILKLIDPRGQFGDYTVYGDSRYELAKLSHSFNGHYESIVNDAFCILCDDNEISYDMGVTDYQRAVSEMFNLRLGVEYPCDKDAVKLIESLLFLSMIPLHGDYLNRQIMMLITGIRTLAEVFETQGLL